MFCRLLVMKFSHKEKLHLVIQEAAVPPVLPSLPALFSLCFPSSIWVTIQIRWHVGKILYMFEGQNIPPVLFSFLPYLWPSFFCYSPDHLKTQGFGRIQGQQWKECSSRCPWLTLARMGKGTGNCHLTLPTTVFSSPWGTIKHISEAFRRIQREENVPSAYLTVWEEMGRSVSMTWSVYS